MEGEGPTLPSAVAPYNSALILKKTNTQSMLFKIRSVHQLASVLLNRLK
jgi:hypothetical protein